MKPKSESGGGILGKVRGGAAGAVGGFFVGGPAGAVTGSGLGSKIGGAAGEAVAPTETEQERGVPLTAMASRPDVQLVQVDEAQKLAMNDPRVPTADQSYLNDTFEATKQMLRKRLGNGA